MFKKIFANVKSNTTVNINGRTYNTDGGNISIKGNKVYVDGELIEDCNKHSEKEINITINGNCNNIQCNGTLHVEGNVTGDIDCGNSVTINGNVDGKINAGNSINIKGSHTGGEIDAGNFVRIGHK